MVTNGTLSKRKNARGLKFKRKKVLMGGIYTRKLLVVSILLRLVISRLGHFDETRNVMDTKMEKQGGWTFCKETHFEDAICLSIAKSEISVTADGIKFTCNRNDAHIVVRGCRAKPRSH